jgi:hypothetical protein
MTKRSAVWLLLWLACCLGTYGLAACSGAGNKAPQGEATGTVGLELTFGGGVTIDALTYAIDNPALLPSELTGMVDVSKSQTVRFVVGGLPAGGGYTITLTASTDNGFPCSSAPASFSIVTGQATGVSISLVCTPPPGMTEAGTGAIFVDAGVTIADAGPPCPAVTALTALPTEASVGGAIQLSATASDPSAVLQWSTSGTAGALGSTLGPDNTFTCTTAGTSTVTVTATTANASCSESASVTLTCDAVGMDAGVCSAVNDGLGGIGVPAGTTATSDAGSSTPPSAAIDGLVGTGWVATGSSATLTLNFPEPVTFTGVGLNVSVAAPTSSNLITFTGLQGETQTIIGTYDNTTVAIPSGVNFDMPAIPFPSPVTYDGLSILFAFPAVTVNEVSLINPSCPPGQGGSFATGTGAPIDAGLSSGGGQDAGASEAGVCELPPFPFFGTAELTGTLATLSTTGITCVPLGAPAPSQGTVTFSVGAAGCSFIYTDSSGAQYVSNLLSTISSAGDTVSCGVSTGEFQAPQAYSPCPELGGHDDGLNTDVAFSVTRSTGAVSISRLCAWSDAVCGGPTDTFDAMGPATSLQLSGSVTCPNGGNLSGVIQCGFGTCSTPSQSCCEFANPQSLGAVCATTVNPSCPRGLGGVSTAVVCDGPESCPAGFVCCPGQVGTAITTPTCQAQSCPTTTEGL